MKKTCISVLLLFTLLLGSTAQASPLGELHFDLIIDHNLVRFAVENIVIALMNNDQYQQNLEAGNHLLCISMILDMLVVDEIIAETNFEPDLAKQNFNPEQLEYARRSHALEAEYMRKNAGQPWRFWRDILGAAILAESDLIPQSDDSHCNRLGEEMRVAFLPFLRPLPEGEGIMDAKRN